MADIERDFGLVTEEARHRPQPEIAARYASSAPTTGGYVPYRTSTALPVRADS